MSTPSPNNHRWQVRYDIIPVWRLRQEVLLTKKNRPIWTKPVWIAYSYGPAAYFYGCLAKAGRITRQLTLRMMLQTLITSTMVLISSGRDITAGRFSSEPLQLAVGIEILTPPPARLILSVPPSASSMTTAEPLSKARYNGGKFWMPPKPICVAFRITTFSLSWNWKRTNYKFKSVKDWCQI